jgi:hypothetical protein|tara:strand:+ start:6818 stop:6982 length:165 start_codon:yes stop_codon:yes gene_type:complete
MPKIRNKKKCYVITGDKNYTYGAFPYSEEGLKKAKRHLRQLKKQHNGNFEIKEQ